MPLHRHIPWFPLSGLLVLLAILPQAVLLAGTSLNIFSQAAPPKPQASQANLKSVSQTGYSLTFDPALWQETNTHPLTLTLYPDTGHATVTITTDLPTTDLLARALITTPTTIGSLPTQKLILAENHFGTPSLYYVYIITVPPHTHTITTRTDGLPQTDQAITKLLANFSTTAKVQGATSTTTPGYSAAEISLLTTPSVANIRYLHCHQVDGTQKFTYLTLPYQFCLTGKGSGVIISPEGHLATGGHVVSTYPEEALGKNLLDAAVKPLTQALIQEISARTGASISPQASETKLHELQANPTALQALVRATYELLDQQALTIHTTNTKIYLNLGSTPFTADKSAENLLSSIQPASGIYTATTIEALAPNYYSLNAILRQQPSYGPDIALLKIDAPPHTLFPAIPLANTLPQPGSPVTIVGFPELVEGEIQGQSILDYTTASVTPTITQGIVSAIKTDPTGDTLLQTDASINSGNSGGPGINELGEIIGFANLTFPGESGNYNFLRSHIALQALITKHHVSTKNNTAYETWKKGVDSYSQQHYRQALKYFSQAKVQYPTNPLVEKLISHTQTAINQGQDKTPLIPIKYQLIQTATNIWTLVLLIAALAALVLGLRHRFRPPVFTG